MPGDREGREPGVKKMATSRPLNTNLKQFLNLILRNSRITSESNLIHFGPFPPAVG